jgi:hypothetical protein
MLSCSSVTEIGSFDSKRKPLVLFLGSFLGSFFHQSLEWFLFVLFLTVLAFTHVSRSLRLGLLSCAENNALPIDLCRLKHLHHIAPYPVVVNCNRQAIAARGSYDFATSCLAHASATLLSGLSSPGMIAQLCFSI